MTVHLEYPQCLCVEAYGNDIGITEKKDAKGSSVLLYIPVNLGEAVLRSLFSDILLEKAKLKSSEPQIKDSQPQTKEAETSSKDDPTPAKEVPTPAREAPGPTKEKDNRRGSHEPSNENSKNATKGAKEESKTDKVSKDPKEEKITFSLPQDLTIIISEASPVSNDRCLIQKKASQFDEKELGLIPNWVADMIMSVRCQM